MALLIFAPARSAAVAAARSHLQSSDHIPVATPGIVLELSDCVPGRYALDASLLGRNMPVAHYDKRFGVTGHCTPKGAHMLPQEHLNLGVPCSTRREGDSEMSAAIP
jgi:hypothetical protein